jgi:chorismate-pyruvate lyase
MLKDDDDAQMWLPGHALGCYENSAALRSWLLTPGLLTERIRDAAGSAFRMTLLAERADGAGGHLREIEMGRGAQVWMYARTRVPAGTLARHPWLAAIGATPLGEALARHGARVRKSEFGYAMLYPEFAVVARALERAGLGPQALWVRRSTFEIDGAPVALREAFLPAIGDAEPRAAPLTGRA